MSSANKDNINTSEDNIRSVTIKVPKAKKKKVVKKEEEPKSEKQIEFEKNFPAISNSKSSLGVNSRWYYNPSLDKDNKKNDISTTLPINSETKSNGIGTKNSNEKNKRPKYQLENKNDIKDEPKIDNRNRYQQKNKERNSINNNDYNRKRKSDNESDDEDKYIYKKPKVSVKKISNYSSDDDESIHSKEVKKTKNNKNQITSYSDEESEDEKSSNKRIKNVKNKPSNKNTKSKKHNDIEEDEEDEEIVYNKPKKNNKNKLSSKNTKNKGYNYNEEEEEDDETMHKKTRNKNKNKPNNTNSRNKKHDYSEEDEEDETVKKKSIKSAKNKPINKKIKITNYSSDNEDDETMHKKTKASNKNKPNNTNSKNKKHDYSEEEEDDTTIYNKPIKSSKNKPNNKKIKITNYSSDNEEDDERSSNTKTKNTKTTPKQTKIEIHKIQTKEKNRNSKSKKIPKKKLIPETVSYKTYIEIDMHGKDKRINKILDWVSIIRDALFDAVEKKVDKVYFITGKGRHSKKRVVLQPLVLLTAKRLGFDAKLKSGNAGIVECNTISYKGAYQEEEDKEEEEGSEYDDIDIYISQENADLYRTFGVGKIKINDDYYDDKKVFFYDEIKEFNDDEFEKNYHYKKSVFKAVKKRYRYMPDVCIEIICMNREKKEALKFAKNFEKALNKNDFEGIAKTSIRSMKSDGENSIAERNDQNVKEMIMTKSLQREYGFDEVIVSYIVHEKKNKKKARKILDRIYNEIPSDFIDYHLPGIFQNYNTLPSKTLLDIAHNKEYVIEDVNAELISKSIAAVGNALGVLNFKNKIDSKRDDGTPKSIPAIEIDLSNAGAKKAAITMERIMNGLCNGSYSKIILKFSPNPKFCKINDVRNTIKQIAHDEKVSIREGHEKSKNRYSFAIINDDNEFNDEEEEDYDMSDDEESANSSSEDVQNYSSDEDQ